MEGIKLLIVIAVAFATDIESVQGHWVDVQPGNITALEGGTVNIIWRWHKPLQYCQIVLPDKTVLFLSQGPNFGLNKTLGFQYLGEGLNSGQCGVSIQSVRAAHHGTVKCSIGSGDKEHTRQMELTVALPPHRLDMKVIWTSRTGNYGIGEQFRAYCISQGGRPPANIAFYLDDEPITDGVGADEIGEASNNEIQKNITRIIEASDDRRMLICRSHHIADRGQPKESKIQLHVEYEPQPLPEINVHRVILESDVIINATIKANPRPRTEWIVDGTAIPQGTKTGRYTSSEPIHLGGGVFNVSLSIASFTLEDTTKIYKLEASSKLGSQQYTVRISSWEAVEGGLRWWAIVGIVLGVAALLIIAIYVLLNHSI